MSSTPSLPGWLLRLAVVGGVFVGAVFFASGPSTRAPASLSTTTTPTTSTPTSACDLAAGPCRVAFDAHHGFTLDVTPRPLRTAAPLLVQGRFDGAATNPRVTFTGATMTMPPTTLALAPQGSGAFVARGSLPLCTEALMPWTARVDVDLDGEPHTATFGFVTRQAPAGSASAGPAGAAGSATDAGVAVVEDVVLLDPSPPVEVVLADGRGPLALSAWRGSVVLVGFGFTSCADVCPTTLASWAAALQRLRPDEQARVRGLFVSVDPDRDTPAHVDEYARFFHPRLHGATGTRAQVDAATRAFGAAYAIHDEPGVDGGVDVRVDHAAYTWVVAPDGRIVARLPHAAAADVTAATLRRFLEVPP